MTWETIRFFGQVRYFNLSYVVIVGVPVLAELYEVLYRVHYGVTLSLPFPLSLKVLYAASLSYALAVAVYQYFCPAIVKVYASSEAYLAACQESYERAYPDRRLEIVLANLTDSQHQIKNELVTLSGRLTTEFDASARRRIDELLHEFYPSCVQRFLLAEYAHAARRCSLAIYTAGVLYILGSACLVYLLVLKSIDVFRI